MLYIVLLSFVGVVFCAMSFYFGYNYGRRVERWYKNQYNEINRKKIIENIKKSNLN
jgi:hypothetical protein